MFLDNLCQERAIEQKVDSGEEFIVREAVFIIRKYVRQEQPIRDI